MANNMNAPIVDWNSVSNRGILRTESISRCVVWTVEDYYNTLLSSGRSVCSDIFRVPTFPNCLFYLSIRLEDDRFLVSINRLIRNRNSFHSKSSSVKISLVLIDESIGLHQNEEFQMTQESITSTVHFKKLGGNCASSIAKKYLEVRCTVSINVSENPFQNPHSSYNHENRNKEFTTTMSIDELQEHLEVLLDGEKEARVVLIVGEQTFNVHKSFLCSHSPVFAAMFEHETLEKSKNEISISDISPDAMGEILKYIYFSTTSEMSVEKIIEVYVAADKYSILDLKYKCSTILKKSLTKDILLDIFKLADRHADKELEQVAIRFLANKGTDVIETDDFLLFMESESELARNIMLHLVKMVPK